MNPGCCIRHGYVIDKCCPLWEKQARISFLSGAVRQMEATARALEAESEIADASLRKLDAVYGAGTAWLRSQPSRTR